MGGISAASTHNHSAATLPDPDHRPNIADLGSKSPIHSEGNILSRITSRASLQKYIKSSIESMVTDAAHGCRNDIPEKPATSSTDTDKQKEKEKEKEQPTVPETLTSLARSGKITSTSSLFDIEVLTFYSLYVFLILRLLRTIFCIVDLGTGRESSHRYRQHLGVDTLQATSR